MNEPVDVDQLIRELLGSRVATPLDVETIIQRMGAAPFDPTPVRVPVKHRGLSYPGRTLGSRDDSLFYHLVKRVLLEEQWAYGTTAADYLADLRRVVLSPAAMSDGSSRNLGTPGHREAARFAPVAVESAP